MARAPKPPKKPLTFDSFKRPPSGTYPVPTSKSERVENLYGEGLSTIKIKEVAANGGSESHLDTINLVGVEDFGQRPWVGPDEIAEAIMAFCFETARGSDEDVHFRCYFLRHVEGHADPDRKKMDVTIRADDPFFADEDDEDEDDDEDDDDRVNRSRDTDLFQRRIAERNAQRRADPRYSAERTQRPMPGRYPHHAASQGRYQPFQAQYEAQTSDIFSSMADGFQKAMSAMAEGYTSTLQAVQDTHKSSNAELLELLKEARHEVRTAREQKDKAADVLQTTLNNQMTYNDNQRQFEQRGWERQQHGIDLIVQSVESQVSNLKEVAGLQAENSRLKWEAENKTNEPPTPLKEGEIPASVAGAVALLGAGKSLVPEIFKFVGNFLKPGGRGAPTMADAGDTSPVEEDDPEDENPPAPDDREQAPRNNIRRKTTRTSDRVDRARARARARAQQARQEAQSESSVVESPKAEPAKAEPAPETTTKTKVPKTPPGRKMPGPKQRARDEEFYRQYGEDYALPPVGEWIEIFAEDVADNKSQVQEAPILITARMLGHVLPPADRERLRTKLTEAEWEAVHTGLVAKSEEEAKEAFTTLVLSFTSDSERGREVEMSLTEIQRHLLLTIVKQLLASMGLAPGIPVVIPPHLQRPYKNHSRYPVETTATVKPAAQVAQKAAPRPIIVTDPGEPPQVTVSAPKGIPEPPPQVELDEDDIPVPELPDTDATPPKRRKKRSKKKKS